VSERACAGRVKRDCNAYRIRENSHKLVSGEAIIINKEETGSLKEKERLLKAQSVHAHTRTHANSDRKFI